MYKVSLINRNFIDGNLLVSSVHELTKYFESNEDANKYLTYLIESKNFNGFFPDVEQISLTQDLDIIELKRQDALAKLTEDEKKILGI